MRSLITGAAGFAGGWLVAECAAAGDEVLALSRLGNVGFGAGPTGTEHAAVAVDLRDGDDVASAIKRARPDVVYHLAALSSVGKSWEDPSRTLSENVTAAVNLLQAMRTSAPDARLVWVSTCEVYGVPVELPLLESAPVAPANPYAVSKAAGEMLASVYASSFGLDLVIARPFSHSGPGQLPIFLLSSLAKQAAEALLGGASSVRVVTGNPDTRRDFTDVRDMVRAYRMLAVSGASGIFNVSSGVSVSAAEQVSLLNSVVAPLPVVHEIDRARVRAHEVMDLRGDHGRLSSATGWEPTIPLRQTMADTVDWWRSALG